MKGIASCREALIDWYENPANKRLSWKFLGQKIGKSGSYISRVAKGQCVPSFEFERDLLAYLYKGRENEVFEYLSGKFPRQVTTMASLTSEVTKEMRFPKPSFYRIYKNRVMYHVFRLSYAAKFTMNEITDIAGPEAPLHIEQLKQDGTVVVQDDIVRRSDDSRNTLNINFQAVIDSAVHNLGILAHRAEIHDLGGTQFDSSQNKVLGLYENLSEEGLSEVIEWLNSSMSDLRLRLQDPKFQGDIPVFINTAAGRFDSSESKYGE